MPRRTSLPHDSNWQKLYRNSKEKQNGFYAPTGSVSPSTTVSSADLSTFTPTSSW
jgi:hypothetical protein